ncbi:MAG: cytochrome c oxidase subunit I [Bacteroidota bacterium]|nr:cytochrome c oxidase subunit I [Bacteroidota bacterium]
MVPLFSNTTPAKTTSWKVVLPFYGYAAVSFLAATVLLFFASDHFTQHYFEPPTLAVTHAMALGWGTMIILGASHQLVPVIVEGKLYSEKLAALSFLLAAIGIPLLVYGFYVFDIGIPIRWGGSLVVGAILLFVVNLGKSMSKSQSQNVHAAFVFTASIWLLLTVSLGLTLAFNFGEVIMPEGSMHYLPLHASLGMIGWFLMLVIGVGARLIPMFLISKYEHPRLLWWVYYLINGALVSFFLIFYLSGSPDWYFLPLGALLVAVVLFLYYCRKAFQQRLRKKVDPQMRLSLFSAAMIALPILILAGIILGISKVGSVFMPLVLCYGFLVFFGWLTALILGMTFKTLPFIVWNKVYHLKSAQANTPSPKELFSQHLFKAMSGCYILGVIVFCTGIVGHSLVVLKIGAVLLIITAFLYTWNVIKILGHKPSQE